MHAASPDALIEHQVSPAGLPALTKPVALDELRFAVERMMITPEPPVRSMPEPTLACLR